MRYEATPRPLIEDHYHIRELIERQEKRTEDRVYFQNKEKEKRERGDIIKDNDPVKLVDFFCGKCAEDFKGVALKQVEIDWNDENIEIAFYKTKCFKGHWCIRLITDRHADPYWTRSKLVALDRGKHSFDTMQPFEEGFNMLYGKK